MNTPVQHSARERLLFLDGLRGLAALYVVATHGLLQIIYTFPNSLSERFRALTHWLLFGQLSVDVFIVLSGFCLMLPVARGGGALRGGLAEFAKRRAWRILPPYYAAVLLSLALIALIPALKRPSNGLWSLCVPPFSAGDLISHLFLAHNLSSVWIKKIDYPLWSVATEWQIYFVFALVLLPLWRRFGNLGAIAAAAVIATGLRVGFHHRLDAACFYFLILFAFGMAAAVAANAQPRGAAERLAAAKQLRLLPWGWISAALWLVIALPNDPWLWAHHEVYDLLAGVATATLLLAATLHARSAESNSSSKPGALNYVVQALEWRPVVALGAFSYSLYLIHAPILALVFAAVLRMRVSAASAFGLSEAVGIPLCLAGAYLFHLAFERPFMSARRPRTEKQAELAAISSPAP